MSDLDDLHDVISGALNAHAERYVVPGNPTLSDPQHVERGMQNLLTALGPLGEAGSTVGDWLRTRGASFDTRDLAPVAAGIMLGTMPGGPEESAGIAAAKELGPIAKAGLNAYHNALYGSRPPREAYDTALNALLGDVPQTQHYGMYKGQPDVDYIHPKTAYMYNNPEYWKKSVPYENTPQFAQDLKNLLNQTPKQTMKNAGLSDDEIDAALAKNPGASIFDIAGTPAPKAGPAPSAAYGGYELHESGEPGDYFIHSPSGTPVGELTRTDSGKYKLEMYSGANGMFNSPMDAFKHGVDAHGVLPEASDVVAQKIAPVNADYSADLRPLDWMSHMPRGVQSPAFPDPAMSQQVRNLGFNVNLPLYKGGALSDYPENLYIPNKQYERGLFFSDRPEIAQKYAQFGNPALEYVARAKNPLTIDWPSATGMSSYDDAMHDIVEAARAKGADLLHVSNISDIGGHQDQYVVLDPSILRAPSAKFDPSQLHLAKPLAGLAGLGLGTGLMFDAQGNPLIYRGQ